MISSSLWCSFIYQHADYLCWRRWRGDINRIIKMRGTTGKVFGDIINTIAITFIVGGGGININCLPLDALSLTSCKTVSLQSLKGGLWEMQMEAKNRRGVANSITSCRYAGGCWRYQTWWLGVRHIDVMIIRDNAEAWNTWQINDWKVGRAN